MDRPSNQVTPAPSTGPALKNVLSVDLESWVHCYRDNLRLPDFAPTSSERKVLDAGYLPEATRRILGLLSERGHRATFFVAGEIHEWYPDLVEEIARAGHEVGYHTHHHALLVEPGTLERELATSAGFLETFRPRGFRAPMIYLRQGDRAVLAAWSFRYSSSSYDSREVFRADGIDELPISTLAWGGEDRVSDRFPKNLRPGMLLRELPFGGAIALPVLGAWISRLIEARNREGRTSSLYIHPWQLFRTPEIESFGYRTRLLLRNPLCLPYAKSALPGFLELLKRHEFTSFEAIHGERWK